MLAAAFLAAVVPAAAHADGDPASDFLLTEDVFVPLDAKVPTAQAGQLTALVADAVKGGYRIKVALIATRFDLGSVTALWRQPQPYARFLGQELYYVYRGRLLIVMPNGYGIYHRGKPVAAERRLLDSLAPPGPSGARLATAAGVAVQRFARQAGLRLALPAAQAPANHTNRDRLEILAIVLCISAIGALIFVPRRRRRASG